MIGKGLRQKRAEFRPGLGVCHGLVAAKGVAKAKAAACQVQHMRDGFAGIGAGGVFCGAAVNGPGGQGGRAGPGALRIVAAVKLLIE